MNLKQIILLSLAFANTAAFAQKQFKLASPDKRLATTISIGDKLTYDISLAGEKVMEPSAINITLADGTCWGDKARLASSSEKHVDDTVASPFYRSAALRNNYNALTLRFRGGWNIEFRAYNDAIAYRYVTTTKKTLYVKDEAVNYRFACDATATVPYVQVGEPGNFESQYGSSFENTYTTAHISELDKGRLMFLPLAVDNGKGVKVAITESNLNDYPGMYLSSAKGTHNLSAVFAPYPKRVEQGGHNNLQMIVKEREDYIAKITKPRALPWRIAVVADDDRQLAQTSVSYLLGEPSRIADTSWIKPGKVAWDWWNDWNIDGVDFRSGVNNDTYKYYIDFAASKGIEYVILDEGWAVNGKADLMQVVPEIDLPGLVKYADGKGVGIILWAGYWAFDRDMERVCRHFSEMGVKGFKVDFMDRDDQTMTDFEYRAAEMCAKYKLVLDLHGSYKPAGMNRTYPNVLNFEGVFGLEQMKWAPESYDQVTYDTQLPFLRQLSGPMDYTQGAMRNASRSNYRPCNSEPMSQGTRCRQLALYMVFDSPLTMLCDNPSNYMREQECTEFIASVPTAWDETRIIEGKMGEYIITARRKGNTWYVGGITNWTPRDITLDLAFTGKTAAKATLFADGANADRAARDYRKTQFDTTKDSKVKLHMAPGGGFAMKIE